MINLLYGLLFIVLTPLYVDVGASYYYLLKYFDPPSGTITAVFLIIGLIISGILFYNLSNKREFISKLLNLCIIWGIWISYLFFRCDFSDTYAKWKFAYIFLQFTLIVLITISIEYDSIKFESYFIPSILLYSILSLAIVMLDPSFAVGKSVYMYKDMERLTFGNSNPIWLARTFAIAIFILITMKKLMHKSFNYLLAIPFAIGIIMTGSRGPLLSLIAILFLYHIKIFKFDIIRISIGIIMLSIVLGLSVYYEDNIAMMINKYIYRDVKVSVYKESQRDILFKKGIDDFVKSPIIGVGLGKYDKKENNIIISGNTISYKAKRKYPHNIIVEILSELGVIGMFLFIVILNLKMKILNIGNKYVCLFILTFLFSMTSGDIIGNSGIFVFNHIAKLMNDKKIYI